MKEVYYEDELSNLPVEKSAEKEKTDIKLDKPYLTISGLDRGDPEKEIALLEWLDYLSSKYNTSELIENLSYYTELGWISEKVKCRLISYIQGFDQEKSKGALSGVQIGNKNYKPEEEGESQFKQPVDSSNVQTRMKEHMSSLFFIYKILAEKIPEEILENMVNRIEPDELENYNEQDITSDTTPSKNSE